MNVTPLELDGLVLIEPVRHHDQRGCFVERFSIASFEEAGLPTSFVQDNHSRSLPRVLRGLHYQHSPDQGKMVAVIRGRVWDVAVDIRPTSATYGEHFAIELNDVNGLLLWIPAGFAHGYCVLGDDAADVVYKVDAPYRRQSEGGIQCADPNLSIPWPIRDPILSERDRLLPSFSNYSDRSIDWAPSTVGRGQPNQFASFRDKPLKPETLY